MNKYHFPIRNFIMVLSMYFGCLLFLNYAYAVNSKFFNEGNYNYGVKDAECFGNVLVRGGRNRENVSLVLMDVVKERVYQVDLQDQLVILM